MKPSASLVRPREQRGAVRRRLLPTAPPIPGFSPRAEDAFAHVLRRVASERLVVGAGLVSLLIYVAFVVAFPITTWWNHPHLATDPTAINDMGRITGYSPVAAAAFITAILALFACQFLALTGVTRVRASGTSRSDSLVRWSVLLFPLAFGAVMVWMQPVTTTDLYGYVARGYLYAQLHQNPMITKAVLLPGGLAVDRPAAPYGPAWLLICGLVSRVFGDNLLANMLAFKAISLASVAVALLLVDQLARKLYPERRLRIDVLFGWSPLLLFEALGNGHNDIVMVVCVLAAFALMLKGRSRTAFGFLVVGALVKYVSAIFVPLWLVYELRHRLKPSVAPSTSQQVDVVAREGGSLQTTVRSWGATFSRTLREVDQRAAIWLLASVTVIGAGLTALAYGPFWVGFRTFTGLGQQLRPLYYNSSIVGFFSAPLIVLVPESHHAALDKTIRLVVYAIFGFYAYLQIQRLWLMGPRATLREVITAAAKITFAALLLITFWFQPWYVVWLLPLAALAREPFVRRQSTILAAGALLTYAVGNFLLVDVGQDLFVQFFEILVAFGPLLLLRTVPYDQGWRSIIRRYAGLVGAGLSERTAMLERVMLVLIVLVAGLLRLVRLGDLFAEAPAGSNAASLLKQASGDLKLFLTDPQGLHGPFAVVEGALVAIFGPTPIAALLPSAVLGSLTVLMIYFLTYEIMRQGNRPGKRAVALLAALLAATSRWHVSLSRSGMEVVLLPLLLCVAVYCLLRALPLREPKSESRTPTLRGGAAHHKSRHQRRAKARSRLPASVPSPASAPLDRRTFLLYAGSGLCTGLACDVAPGLWLVPLVIVGVLLLWRLSQPSTRVLSRSGIGVLLGSAVVSGIPVIWHFVNANVGFPAGSDVLARNSSPAPVGPGIFSLPFWGQVAHNAGDTLGLLASQDYSAGYPAVSGTPIIPTLLGPFFYIGLLVVLLRWRNFASMTLLVLVALPLVASIAVGTPTSVIEAASVLPAMCIVPAVALYEVGSWLGHLPIFLDRVNGVRVFSTPEQIGRVLLLGFLLVSTVRTFYWYFEVTLPSSSTNQYEPTAIGSNIVRVGSEPDYALNVLLGVWGHDRAPSVTLKYVAG